MNKVKRLNSMGFHSCFCWNANVGYSRDLCQIPGSRTIVDEFLAKRYLYVCKTVRQEG